MISLFKLSNQIKTYIITHKKQTIIGVTVLFVALYGVVFFLPRPVAYSYSGDSCVAKLTVLPGIHQTPESSPYDVTYTGGVWAGSVPLVATQACFTPQQAPQEGAVTVASAPWGIGLVGTQFALEVPPAPVANVAVLTRPVPVTQPLELALDQSDTVFEYALTVDDQTTDCATKGTTLACDLAPLDLTQGASYEATLTREFEGELDAELHTGKLETLRPLKITKASVKHKQTVYVKPKVFTVEVDKPIASAEVSLTRERKDKAPQEIPVEASFDEKKLTITVADDLPRSSAYTLTLEQLTAHDGSTLAKPQVIAFETSGGPELSHASVGATGALLAGSITLTFDQSLSPDQDIAKLVAVEGVGATVARHEASLVVSYQGASTCAPIKIVIKQGLLSEHKVEQANAITFTTRTQCHTVETIGYSHEGRPINAYFFGGGNKTILFTGAIHGSEKSSYSTMMSWVNELEAGAHDIPKGTQVVVAPMLNPDGYYVYGRDNARKVNLNRNFPTANWEKDVTVSGGKVDKGGGGRSAGSERETQVLMALTNRLNPHLTVTYHSQGAFINSNAVAPAATLGARYASLAGYGFVPDEATASTFGFTMTGTYEDWMTQTGRAAFLVELPTHHGDYMGYNRTALWAMVRT